MNRLLEVLACLALLSFTFACTTAGMRMIIEWCNSGCG